MSFLDCETHRTMTHLSFFCGIEDCRRTFRTKLALKCHKRLKHGVDHVYDDDDNESFMMENMK
jgi:hypothetical protein